jgi:hypothetical protein
LNQKSVDISGDFENADISLKGGNFDGTASFYGETASHISGKFNYITENKEAVLGSFVGKQK